MTCGDMQPFNFDTTSTIRFGAGHLDRLGEIAAPLLGARVVLVTDPGLMGTDMPGRAQAALRAAGAKVQVFSEVTADPCEQVILAARDAMLETRATGVLGLGGGSSLDVAKLAAALAFSGAKLRSSYGIGQLSAVRLPLALMPTTAGTGSEVTPIAIVTTGENEKTGVVSRILLPDMAVLDPETTLGLPAPITAATGIDAIVHAIEAHCSTSPNNNLVSRALAREALRLMGRALETAVATPTDLSARTEMLLGSLLAGQAFANSPVAAVHALAYPIGGRFKVSHGLSNALVLPHVLRFNAETAPDGYAEIAPILFPNIKGSESRALAFCDALEALINRCALPTRLRDIGIPWEALAAMAADVINQTRLLQNNPREITQADALKLYESAW